MSTNANTYQKVSRQTVRMEVLTPSNRSDVEVKAINWSVYMNVEHFIGVVNHKHVQYLSCGECVLSGMLFDSGWGYNIKESRAM